MGKAEKQRRQRGTNPTGLPTVKEAEKLVQASSQMHIVKQLTSTDKMDRELACSVLANVFSDGGDEVQQKEDVSLKLIQLLCDPEMLVGCAAAGALRNLAIGGGEQACGRLMNEDIMTVIVSQLTKIGQKLVAASAEDPEREDLAEFLTHIISYLYRENSELATSAFTNSGLLVSVFRLLRPDIFPIALVDAVLQFLNVITDDNPLACQQLVSVPEYSTVLTNIMSLTSLPVEDRVLASSVLVNLVIPDTVYATIGACLPLLASTLSSDSHALLAQLGPALSEIPTQLASPESDLSRWLQLVNGQKLALEVISNICSSSDESAFEDISDDEAPSTVVVYGRRPLKSSDVNRPESNGVSESGLDVGVMQAIVGAGLVPLVTSRCAFIPTDLGQALSQAPVLLSAVRSVQLRALACLQNFVLFLPTETLGDVPQLWNSLMSACATCLASDMHETLDRTTSLMWGILRKCPTLILAINLIGQLIRHNSESIRASVVGMLGIVGQHILQPQLNAMIGKLLLDVLGDQSLRVVAESLNSIFDVYGETTFDSNFITLGAMDILQQFIPRLQQRIRQEKSTLDRELLGQLADTRTNLTRFVQYKLRGSQ